jgi:hypothetical protein
VHFIGVLDDLDGDFLPAACLLDRYVGDVLGGSRVDDAMLGSLLQALVADYPELIRFVFLAGTGFFENSLFLIGIRGYVAQFLVKIFHRYLYAF